jgi:hypothetical protein
LPTPPQVREQPDSVVIILNFAAVLAVTVKAATAVLEVVAVNAGLKFRMLTRKQTT